MTPPSRGCRQGRGLPPAAQPPSLHPSVSGPPAFQPHGPLLGPPEVRARRRCRAGPRTLWSPGSRPQLCLPTRPGAPGRLSHSHGVTGARARDFPPTGAPAPSPLFICSAQESSMAPAPNRTWQWPQDPGPGAAPAKPPAPPAPSTTCCHWVALPRAGTSGWATPSVRSVEGLGFVGAQ